MTEVITASIHSPSSRSIESILSGRNTLRYIGPYEPRISSHTRDVFSTFHTTPQKSRQRQLTLVFLARKSLLDLTSTPFYRKQVKRNPSTTSPSHPPTTNHRLQSPPPPYTSPYSSPLPTKIINSIPIRRPPPLHSPTKNSFPSPPNPAHPSQNPDLYPSSSLCRYTLPPCL